MVSISRDLEDRNLVAMFVVTSDTLMFVVMLIPFFLMPTLLKIRRRKASLYFTLPVFMAEEPSQRTNKQRK